MSKVDKDLKNATLALSRAEARDAPEKTIETLKRKLRQAQAKKNLAKSNHRD